MRRVRVFNKKKAIQLNSYYTQVRGKIKNYNATLIKKFSSYEALV
jgi:hypothetical protein